MHATIQKPITEIIEVLKPGERVFVVGCGNCAAKCHSGGETETVEMAERLSQKGVSVVAATPFSAVKPSMMSLSPNIVRFAESVS